MVCVLNVWEDFFSEPAAGFHTQIHINIFLMTRYGQTNRTLYISFVNNLKIYFSNCFEISKVISTAFCIVCSLELCPEYDYSVYICAHHYNSVPKH